MRAPYSNTDSHHICVYILHLCLPNMEACVESFIGKIKYQLWLTDKNLWLYTPPDHGGLWTPLIIEFCDACKSL